MIRIRTAHPLFHLVHSNFFIRAIVKGHPLNTFDVLFFDSIIAKLARAHRVHIAVSTQNCGIKRSKQQTPNRSCYFYRPWYVFIFRPRFTNFISYSRIFPDALFGLPPSPLPISRNYFSKFSTTLFKIS